MDLGRHPHFTAWQDPQSGVVSYRLTEEVAPLQKSFYFVNPCIADGGEWLWLETAYPPARYRTLSALSLDPDCPEVRRFPQASVSAESPLLHNQGRQVWLVLGDREPAVWNLDLDGHLEPVGELPQSYIDGRQVQRISTHLTCSADGKHLLLDGRVGASWFTAVLEIASGNVTVLKEFGRHYNHGQFHPTHPGLFSLAQDWWHERDSGRWHDYDLRIWLLDLDGTRFEPLGAVGIDEYGAKICHEWWSGDGQMCWVEYNKGAFECELDTRACTHVWKRPLCHAHCTANRRFWVADQSPYQWPETPCQVLFFDREQKQEIEIVSAMQPPPMPRGWYHLDPHPRFVRNDTLIAYTTMVEGKVTLALTPVAQLVT